MKYIYFNFLLLLLYISKDTQVIRKIYSKQDKEEKKYILAIRDEFLRGKYKPMVTQK